MIIWTSKQPIGCAYPLDADAAEIASTLPGYGKLAPSADEQSGTMTLAGSPQNLAMMQVGWPTSGAAYFDLTDGRKVIEIPVTCPTVTSTVVGSNTTDQFAYLTNGAESVAIEVIQNYIGLFNVNITGGSLAIGLATAPSLIALGFDATTSSPGTANLTIWIDGANYGTVPNYPVAADLVAAIICKQTFPATGPLVGQTMSIGIRTVASEMTGSYPGYTDVCGNPIG